MLATSAWALPDFDGDGFLPPQDCNNVDPAVAPDKPDLPDLAFEDANCDGIDGTVSDAVFVSRSTGDDAFGGSRDFPKRTIGAAISVAAADGKDVYVTAGPYNEVVSLEDSVDIYGGYVPGTFQRSTAEPTVISGAPQAVLANDDQHVVLQLLTLNGTPPGGAGQSAYGLRAVNGSSVALRAVTASGADASAGAAGASFRRPPTPSRPSPASCGTGDGSRGARGTGGGNLGGLGGAGGFASSAGLPGSAGNGPSAGTAGPAGASNTSGQNGGTAPLPGAPGANGTNGSFGFGGAAASWVGTDNSSSGEFGDPGSGGGGGGGSGGIFLPGIFSGPGAGGGGGGAGGSAGIRGLRGRPGGGSFGAYLFNSTLVAAESELTGGNGGSGGNGGNGTPGGLGGPGGFGAFPCGLLALRGGDGGSGSSGGAGGDGGGGSGGPSAGVFRTGAGSVYTSVDSTESAGTPGAGGTRGTSLGAPRASAGQSADFMSAPSATGTTADFDGDGLTDASDDCPDVAAPAADADGCVNRPGKLTDADDDQIPDSSDRCPSNPRGTVDLNEDGCADTPPPAPKPTGRDADGDGFFAGQDCNDGNPNIRPGAQEIVGNNIDENCDGRATPFPRINVTLSQGFKAFSKFTKLTRLKIKNVPAGSTVRATCKLRKKKCRGKARKAFTKRNASGTVSLNKRYKGVKLRVGTRITVRVTRAGNIGAVKVLKIRRRKEPKTTTRCLPPGTKRPARC